MFYFRATKARNRFLKYTFDMTEYGMKTVVTTAKPIMNQFEKPSEYSFIPNTF